MGTKIVCQICYYFVIQEGIQNCFPAVIYLCCWIIEVAEGLELVHPLGNKTTTPSPSHTMAALNYYLFPKEVSVRGWKANQFYFHP